MPRKAAAYLGTATLAIKHVSIGARFAAAPVWVLGSTSRGAHSTLQVGPEASISVALGKQRLMLQYTSCA